MELNGENLRTLKNMLREEEGFRRFPYKCSANKLTIGIGRNLDDRGIFEQEALMLLENDIQYFMEELNKRLAFFSKLDAIRQIVLIDMAFNLGINNLLNFKNTLAYVERKNYQLAAQEMLNSRWAEQVGRRAIRLSKMMRTGQYQQLV